MLKRFFLEHGPAALVGCMLTTLFVSRAGLSISMIVFIAMVLVVNGKKSWLPPATWRSTIISFGLLFLLPLVSGLWSSNSAEWFTRSLVKLPLLALAIAMAVIRFTSIQVFAVHLLFVFCVWCGTLYTLYEYLLQPAASEAGYDTARVLPTLADGDHIRFSWLVVIAIIILLLMQQELLLKKHRIGNGLLIAWLAVFLHILAAKTGLLMLYIVLIVYAFYRLRKTGKKWLWVLPAAVILMPFIAYNTVPTFKKRVDYIRYDFAYYSKGEYREGLSDGARVVSLQAGWKLFTRQPLTGIGFGDIRAATQEWYQQQRPQLKDYERILPSSQLLLYAASCGIAGAAVLLWAIGTQLAMAIRRRNMHLLLFITAAVPGFCYEIHLESQYGVFIFCFFALWFGHQAPTTKISA